MPIRTNHPPGGSTAGANLVPPELLDVSQVAGRLNCSKRSVYRLADNGKMPRPVKLGTLVRWRVEELYRWIGQGCPEVGPIAKRQKFGAG